MRTMIADAVAAVLFPLPASAQTWHTEVVEDEFDGARTTYITQIGGGRQLVLTLTCDDAGVVVGLNPGPAVRWRVFEHGTVDLRLDGGPAVSVSFEDFDTSLLSPAFDVGMLTNAETVMIRASAYRQGTETDTFQMPGLESALEAAGCGPG